MVSQPFLYICVGKYTIAMVEVTTQEYVDNISYISTFYNRAWMFYSRTWLLCYNKLENMCI